MCKERADKIFRAIIQHRERRLWAIRLRDNGIDKAPYRQNSAWPQRHDGSPVLSDQRRLFRSERRMRSLAQDADRFLSLGVVDNWPESQTVLGTPEDRDDGGVPLQLISYGQSESSTSFISVISFPVAASYA